MTPFIKPATEITKEESIAAIRAASVRVEILEQHRSVLKERLQD